MPDKCGRFPWEKSTQFLLRKVMTQKTNLFEGVKNHNDNGESIGQNRFAEGFRGNCTAME